jgi:hypothetical protein
MPTPKRKRGRPSEDPMTVRRTWKFPKRTIPRLTKLRDNWNSEIKIAFGRVGKDPPKYLTNISEARMIAVLIDRLRGKNFDHALLPRFAMAVAMNHPDIDPPALG